MSEFENLIQLLKPANNDPCFEGDFPWESLFPSFPILVDNPLFMKSISDEGDLHDPKERIEDVQRALQYLHETSTWWRTKALVHGGYMDELKMKVAKATFEELEATLLMESRAAKLKELEMQLEEAKDEAIYCFKQTQTFKDELAASHGAGYDLFRDVTRLMELDNGSSKRTEGSDEGA